MNSSALTTILKAAGFAVVEFNKQEPPCVAVLLEPHESPLTATAQIVGSVANDSKRAAVVIVFESAFSAIINTRTVIYFPTVLWD